MLARDLINDSFPPLKPSDSGLKALKWLETFKLDHIPLVEGMKYAGLITEADVLRLNSLEQPIENQAIPLIHPAVKASQPVFIVVKTLSRERLTAIPVVDEENNYLGLITLGDLLKHYSESGVFEESTGVIVLKMQPHEYSLSKIAHLIEAEDAKILSSYITPDAENESIGVTLKVNQADLSRILASLNRYGYYVTEHYNQEESVGDMKSRYDALIKYLEI